MKANLFIICIAFIFFQCNNADKENTTTGGYHYDFINDEPGETAVEGQYVYFAMDILDDQGNVLQSYAGEDLQPSVVIPGDDEAILKQNPVLDLLKRCSVGDSVSLIIPKDSMPQIPPQFAQIQYLDYRVKVKEIMDEQTYQDRMSVIQEEQAVRQQELMGRVDEIKEQLEEVLSGYRGRSLGSRLLSGDEGLEYVILEEGTGKLPEENRNVSVHYYGTLMDGTMFDNSFSKGVPYTFPLGRGEVIQGWDVGVALLKEGTRAVIFLPPDLGYGEQGSPPQIPPNSKLAFYVEIEKAY